ncbi:hypothetical protein [Paludisphaera mucosa]|uniref:Inner membrane protein YbaN n=1 Tax=Paludisphaera mucosa TaxID=3030827 RepID=A0ABT6FHP1_9BACT|nr:hypothetical protein [Paludisphaera mucosa]MDG3007111.1 hypothetical protein [Paludisphaera mucosa]
MASPQAAPPSLDAAREATWSLVDGRVATFHAPRLIRPGREAFCRSLAARAARLPGVIWVQVCTSTSTWRVEFADEAVDAEEVSALLVRCIAEAVRDVSVRESTDREPSLVRRASKVVRRVRSAAFPRSTRGRDLLLAGGSFLMVGVGVVLPGIPSAPFALSALYFSVRLWPGLRQWLARFPRLLAVLDAPLPRPELREVVRTVVIAALAVGTFAFLHPPLILVVGLEVVLLAVYVGRWLRRDAGADAHESVAAPPQAWWDQRVGNGIVLPISA